MTASFFIYSDYELHALINFLVLDSLYFIWEFIDDTPMSMKGLCLGVIVIGWPVYLLLIFYDYWVQV